MYLIEMTLAVYHGNKLLFVHSFIHSFIHSYLSALFHGTGGILRFPSASEVIPKVLNGTHCGHISWDALYNENLRKLQSLSGPFCRGY